MTAPSAYRPALRAAFEHALAYLDALDHAPVGATATLAELRARLGHPLREEGLDARAVVDELVADVAGGLLGSAGGRFFGWVIGGSVPAAVAADWLTIAWDQNAAIHACSPAEAVIEEVVGEYLRQLLALPASASVAFVTGTQMAHVTCLAAARHALLADRGWDVEQRGLVGAPALRVICGDERHGTVDRAARLLGLGSESLLVLPTDEHSRVPPAALRQALAGRDGGATVVVLQAGELNTGAFDDFAELIPLAHAHGAWVHVDGAFGLWAAASPRFRHLTEGAARADSWATDGHKWLNVPYDSGFALVAEPNAHRASMTHRASYMSHVAEARDELDWNPEWSRRGRAVATYAAIRHLGREGVANLVERCCEHARTLTRRIGGLAGAELLWEPVINQGLVRFLDPRGDAGQDDHDARTDQVIAEIVREGVAFFGGVTWRGRRCMRISVSNWQTSASDVDRAVSAVEGAIKRANGLTP